MFPIIDVITLHRRGRNDTYERMCKGIYGPVIQAKPKTDESPEFVVEKSGTYYLVGWGDGIPFIFSEDKRLHPKDTVQLTVTIC